VLLLSSGSAIVLDETTTVQDRGHLNKFVAWMKMLNGARKTIILISHDMDVVAEYASRTIVMNDGGILMDAGTREFFSQSDILWEASIEPHLLARACNDVRRAGQDVPVLLTVGELERYVGWGEWSPTSGSIENKEIVVNQLLQHGKIKNIHSCFT